MRRKKILYLVIGLAICLSMVRLGYWQLGRAAQKQQMLELVQQRARLPVVNILHLQDLNTDFAQDQHVHRQVSAHGKFESGKSILIDNQVRDSRVGYRVFTPLAISDSNWFVLVDRGWVSVGESRSTLPKIVTTNEEVTISGRLQRPPAQPPLWNDEYSVSDGMVWQYLPITDYARQMQLKLLPLVLELAPDDDTEADPSLAREWAEIDDQWVAKHRGYAFQWFAMAAAFFIACLVLLVRSNKAQDK